MGVATGAKSHKSNFEPAAFSAWDCVMQTVINLSIQWIARATDTTGLKLASILSYDITPPYYFAYITVMKVKSGVKW